MLRDVPANSLQTAILVGLRPPTVTFQTAVQYTPVIPDLIGNPAGTLFLPGQNITLKRQATGGNQKEVACSRFERVTKFMGMLS